MNMLRKSVLISLTLAFALVSVSLLSALAIPALAQTKVLPTATRDVQRTATAAARSRTATAAAKAAAATATAAMKATSVRATAEAKSVTATAAARSRAATAEAKAAAATATAAVLDEEIRRLAQYRPIDLKALLEFPEIQAGEFVFVNGRVFNIVSGADDLFQIYAAGTDDALMIRTNEPFTDVIENQAVIIYGMVEGKYCFDNSAGQEICQPVIRNAYVFKQQTQAMRLARSTAAAEDAAIKREKLAAEATDAAAVRETATAEAAEYTRIADRELSTYPDAHYGEKVRVRARVFNVVTNAGVIQANLLGNREAIYIDVSESFYGIYEGDVIEVFGEVAGIKCFTNIMGSEICHPHINRARIVK